MTGAQVSVEPPAAHALLGEIRREVGEVVVGQEALLDRLLIALLVRGHVLIEGVPGLAKTLLVKTLAETIEGSFKRIQFTPDLLPADITGTLVFDPAHARFEPRLGPVFANLVLADEINRAPSKVQSALLEAMQERQVTIGDHSYALPVPFVVVATQNPIEQEGTYPLPEAQIDRFLMKLIASYPTGDEEAQIVTLYLDPVAEPRRVRTVAHASQLEAVSESLTSVHVDERIVRYAVSVVGATRAPAAHRLSDLQPLIAFGASPRATLALVHVAKGHAFLQNREFVIPDDIKAVAHDVLRHRLVLTYEAAAQQVRADDLIDRILGAIAVP